MAPKNEVVPQIVILGGFGNVGLLLTEKLLKYTDYEITIGDSINKNLTKIFPFTSKRLSYKKIDAFRPESLKSCVEKSDLVINCIGPAHRYGVQIAKTIIELGKNCIDFCDEPSVTQGILDLNNLAKEMGVTYITGIGFSPGLSNLLVMKAASQLERVISVTINVILSPGKNSGKAFFEHLLFILSENVPVYRNRKRLLLKPCSEPTNEKFPHPLGWISVSNIGYPEVVTLPLYLDTSSIYLKGAVIPLYLFKFLKFSSRATLYRSKSLREFFVKQLKNSLKDWLFFKENENSSALKVSVEGIKLGQPLTVSLSTMGNLSELISLPAYTIVKFLIDGDIKNHGVFPVEGCVDEEKALISMSKMGLVYTFSERFHPV